MKLRDGINRLLRGTPYQLVKCGEQFPTEDPLADLARIYPPDSFRTIFDVGANRGQTLLKLAAHFPAAAIHAFEPFPETFALLQQAAAPFPQATVVNSAVGEVVGSVRLNLHSLSEMHSLLELDPHPGVQAVGHTEVRQTTVDDYCREQAIGTLDLLKIDVEGAEMKVLRGAQATFSRKKVRAVLLEVMASPHYVGQADFGEVWSYLRQAGYRFVGLYHLHPNPDRSLAWCDALFIA